MTKDRPRLAIHAVVDASPQRRIEAREHSGLQLWVAHLELEEPIYRDPRQLGGEVELIRETEIEDRQLAQARRTREEENEPRARPGHLVRLQAYHLLVVVAVGAVKDAAEALHHAPIGLPRWRTMTISSLRVSLSGRYRIRSAAGAPAP